MRIFNSRSMRLFRPFFFATGCRCACTAVHECPVQNKVRTADGLCCDMQRVSDATAESKILMAMPNAITGEGKKLVFDLLSAA